MKSAAYIFQHKASQFIHTIGPDETVYEAVHRMAEHNIGALVVMDGERMLGIVSERDYARKVILRARSSRETKVREVMSSPVMSVAPEEDRDRCMALMTEHRFRHLPIMSEGRLVGLISIGDVVKDIISEQQFVIDQLQHYIMGDRA